MADVQLEHGHVRIANRLFEAILDAEFTATQVRILLGLVRLTYGWRRRTVTIGQAALARAVHLNPGGTFRAALRELVTEGVVIQVEQGKGDAPSTLMLQKDFTQWGEFAVSPMRLARIYGERPESHDELLDTIPESPASSSSDTAPDGEVVGEGSASKQAGGAAPYAQTEAGGAPQNGQGVRLILGVPTTAKSLSDNAATVRKDNDRQGKPEDEVVVDRERALVRFVVMANKGLAEHADHPQPIADILVGQPSAAEATHTILDAGVPVEFAESALYQLAKAHRARGPVRSLKYFSAAVVKEWRRAQASAAAAGAEAPANDPTVPRRPGPALQVSAASGARVEAGKLVARIRELAFEHVVPGQGGRKAIRNADVERLGGEVYRAYRIVGGPARFLAVESKPSDLPFLINAFADALADARAHPQEVQSA